MPKEFLENGLIFIRHETYRCGSLGLLTEWRFHFYLYLDCLGEIISERIGGALVSFLFSFFTIMLGVDA